MNDELLVEKFEKMGARLKIRTTFPRRGWGDFGNAVPTFNILTDNRGEYYDMRYTLGVDMERAEVQILDLQPKDRHLLLMVKTPEIREGTGNNKSKFLMGHDERHWFVAAVPEKITGVSRVIQAKQALQPMDVRIALERAGVKEKDKLKRRNDAFLRQGEWFFLPVPNLIVQEDRILRDEPLTRGGGIRRGGGKPHMMEYCYRTGGESVYVNHQYPTGITVAKYNSLTQDARKRGNFRMMVKDAGVYAKGKISHSDHATLNLPCWHRIVMNTENQAAAMRHVAFLD
jgi:hypothetical protein